MIGTWTDATTALENVLLHKNTDATRNKKENEEKKRKENKANACIMKTSYGMSKRFKVMIK